MPRLLCVIDEVVALPKRDMLLIMPSISADNLPQPWPNIVMLKRPDGTSFRAGAAFTFTNTTPPMPEQGWRIACALKAVDKDDVPLGTEVWIEP